MANSRLSSPSHSANEMVIAARFHGRKAFGVFQEMRSNTEFCDVVLKVSNLTLHAHRLILAGISPFFRQEFSAKGSEQNEILLPKDVNPDAARSILDFIYTGELTANLKNVQDLLYVARMFQVRTVYSFL